MPFAFLKMSNHLTGPEENSPSSVESFFKDVGRDTAKFGGKPIGSVTGIYHHNTTGEVVNYYREESLSCRESKSIPRVYLKGSGYIRFRNKENGDILEPSIIDDNGEVSSSTNTSVLGEIKLSFKEKIKNLFRNDELRHITKFLLFAAGTALFIVGMFFPPVSAIAALKILVIAVTRFIFKAVHIIKQASNNYFVGNRINTIVKTIFRLLIAAAEIPAFFFGGPLASLITQPISGAILGIMKAYDDIKTKKRMEAQKCDNVEIDELYDHDDDDDDDDNNMELEGDYSFSFRDSNSTNNMNIDYA